MKENETFELPEDMRCALYSLQADMDYLIARIRTAEPEELGMLRQSIFERLSHVEEAAYRLNATAQQLTAAQARIAALEAALRELSEGWDCCNVSRSMRDSARAALAKGDGG